MSGWELHLGPRKSRPAGHRARLSIALRGLVIDSRPCLPRGHRGEMPHLEASSLRGPLYRRLDSPCCGFQTLSGQAQGFGPSFPAPCSADQPRVAV